MSNQLKIRIRGLKKTFGTKTVLDGLDLDVGEGESIVVIGGSGIGKSVLLKCILGLLIPDEGSITVDGEEVIGMDTKNRDRINGKFGMLFQGAALFDSLSVWENVVFGVLSLKLMGRTQAKELAIKKLAQVGMNARTADVSPAALSNGMQKRVGLARAISMDPDIIFFDEPTTGLDPIMSGVINNLIVKTIGEVGATGVTITHDMESAQKVGDRIAMLYDGRIIWTGSSNTVLDSKNEYVNQFVKGKAQGPIQNKVRE